MSYNAFNLDLLNVPFYNKPIEEAYEALKNGADINCDHGQFLFSASSRGNIALVNLFIQAHGDLNLSKNKSFLEAVSIKNLPILQILGSYITKKEIFDIALISISRNGPLDICEYLISLGADIFYKDCLAFRTSISSTNIPIIDYFVSLGCPLSYVSQYIAPQEPKSESDYQLESYLLKKKLDNELIQHKITSNSKL